MKRRWLVVGGSFQWHQAPLHSHKNLFKFKFTVRHSMASIHWRVSSSVSLYHRCKRCHRRRIITRPSLIGGGGKCRRQGTGYHATRQFRRFIFCFGNWQSQSHDLSLTLSTITREHSFSPGIRVDCWSTTLRWWSIRNNARAATTISLHTIGTKQRHMLHQKWKWSMENLYFPETLVHPIIKWYHEQLNHIGMTRLTCAIATHFYHPHLNCNIKEIVQHCDVVNDTKLILFNTANCHREKLK